MACVRRTRRCRKEIVTLSKIYFYSNLIKYDRGDSFPFDFEPTEIPFGSKLKGKLSPRSYPIQYERKCNASFLSVICAVCKMKPNMSCMTHSQLSLPNLALTGTFLGYSSFNGCLPTLS